MGQYMYMFKTESDVMTAQGRRLAKVACTLTALVPRRPERGPDGGCFLQACCLGPRIWEGVGYDHRKL